MNTRTVAIVGAGIGGLAAAIALRRRGFEVHLYEQAPELREFGAGLNVTPNGARVLDAWGLREPLDRISASAGEQLIRDYETMKVMFTRPGARLTEERFGFPHYQVHRGDLLSLLLEAVPKKIISLSKRLVRVEQSQEHVTLGFDDGTHATADVVIGADGIRSVVRQNVIGETPPRFLKKMSFRALVPVAALPQDYFSPDVSFWVAEHGHLVTYLVSGGRNINVVAGAPTEAWTDTSWSVPSSAEEFIAAFPALNEHVRRIVEAAPAVYKWGVFDLPSLDRWSVGRVTLLGDAAHAMLPMHGQGANMAIEDADVLAAWLDAERDDPVKAFAAYEAARRPRTTRQQRFAPAETQAMEDLLASLRTLGPAYTPPPPSDLSWLYDYDATTQWNEIGSAAESAVET